MIVILLFHVLSRACTTFLRSAQEDIDEKMLAQKSSIRPKKFYWSKEFNWSNKVQLVPKRSTGPKKSLTGPKRTWNIFLHSWHMNWFSLLCVLK